MQRPIVEELGDAPWSRGPCGRGVGSMDDPGGSEDATWLTQVVQRAVRTELSGIRAQLVDLRADMRQRWSISPPAVPRGEVALIPRPPGRPLSPAPPTDLPGALAEEVLCGGRLGRGGSSSSIGDSTGVARAVARLSTGDAALRCAASGGASASPRTSAYTAEYCMRRTTCVEQGSMQVLNFGAVKSRAQTIRRQQQSIRTRTSVSYDDDADASVFKKRTQQTVWEARPWPSRFPKREVPDMAVVSAGASSRSVLDKKNLSRMKKFMSRVILSTPFDVFVCFVLVVNAVFIGVQANQSSSLQKPPSPFRTLEVAFCIFFTIELALRLFALGRLFFSTRDWWNYFDFMLVILQLLDEVTILALGSGRSENMLRDMSAVRLLRVLRLLRILRLLRVIRFVSELKKVIYLIMGSLPSFFWAMVLLTLLMYILAVFFTQIVADSSMDTTDGSNAPQMEALRIFFGSTLSSTLTLYKAVSGGVDWQDISTPVIEHVSPFAGMMFITYNAFAVLVLLNLVTGVFVDGAMKLSRADKEVELLDKAYKLLKDTDADDSGDITLDEFKSRLDSPEMSQFFEALEISMARADDLFHLIDSSEDGRLSLEELVAGGLMLQGPAKLIDIASLTKYLQESIEAMRDDIQCLARGSNDA